ncbi:hypothetical protein [Alteromonas sp. P256]|uniref:hypothetical protein n=1 Tax=Alteromonas sp. P256 TaxID=3117399 RepID=UPI002FE1FAC0
MKFKFSYAIGAAALLLMLEAVYAFITSPELNTHHDSLQTALLFIILGICYELLEAKKDVNEAQENANKQQRKRAS